MEMPLRWAPADTGADVQSEPRTFDAFYGSVHRPLFGALCVITGNRADAEDISQEAFLRVWERWERVALMDNPEAFLFRTAMNVFRNRLRGARLAIRRRSAAPIVAAGFSQPDLYPANHYIQPHYSTKPGYIRVAVPATR